MESVLELLGGLVKLLAALLVLGLATERGTELLKVFWNMVTDKFPVLNLHDKRSFLFAALVAVSLSYYFNIDVIQYLAVLDGFDPRLVELVNALLITVVSNSTHDKLFSSGG